MWEARTAGNSRPGLTFFAPIGSIGLISPIRLIRPINLMGYFFEGLFKVLWENGGFCDEIF